MLNRVNFDKVYLACGATDMRRSIDGLAAIVQECFRLDPFSASLFVFCNRQMNRMKILRWEHNGFWLYYRRLEKGRFRWPKDNACGTIATGSRELNWLLDGLSLEQKQAHPKIDAKAVI
jgi:transposase